MPRSYSMGKREGATNETRLRILAATREILADESEAALSMEGVASRADVSRLTIYYQFKSRSALLEALYDYLAMRGNMRRIGELCNEPDPHAALDKLVSIFMGFWSSDRVVIRRLRAMAALDAEIREGIESRDARRHRIVLEILKRMAGAANKKHDDERLRVTADIIAMLTGFATYDALAAAGHAHNMIVAIIAGLVHRSVA